MNIQNEAAPEFPREFSREFSHEPAGGFARDEISVDWPQWIESIPRLHRWRQAGPARYLTVNIDTDLSVEHENFQSLMLADRIVINIESYVDGRIFSLARVLRDHLGFSGELQASGDYLPDQVRFLRRCGIDSFSDPDVLERTVKFFSEFYQPASAILDNEVYIRDARHPEQAG